MAKSDLIIAELNITIEDLREYNTKLQNDIHYNDGKILYTRSNLKDVLIYDFYTLYYCIDMLNFPDLNNIDKLKLNNNLFILYYLVYITYNRGSKSINIG